MKHLKVMSALLSAVICVSVVLTPASALADETSVPEETQTAQETETPDDQEKPAEEEEEIEDQLPGDSDRKEALDAVGSGKCGKKLKWSLDKKGTLKITGKGAMNNYSNKDGIADKYTRPWDKYSSRIKKVVFSKGVTYIGTMSFCDCPNLKSVKFPKKLKSIGFGAFARCPGLNSVSIPKSVGTIGGYAFAETGIKSISIPASVKTLGESAFAGCASLKTVNLPVSGLVSIGKNAFYSCTHLNEFRMPLTVTSVGDYAFAKCQFLCQVWLAEKQKANLPDNTFEGSPNKYFFEHSYSMIGETFPEGDLAYIVTNPATGGTSGTVAVFGIVNQDAERVVIPAVVEHSNDNGYTKVNYRVTGITRTLSQFNNNLKMKNLVIGKNVTVIEDDAFANCPDLESVTGGAGLKTIGARAFANCPNLKTFKITSKALKKIGASAFNGDVILNTLYLKKTTKLTKSGVKNSLAGSSVKTVKVKKKKIKKYKKIFKKKNCGKKVKVKK